MNVIHKVLSWMNPIKGFEEIKLNSFNVLHQQDERIADQSLNYFNKMHSKNFVSPHVLQENTKWCRCDIETHENLSPIHVNIRSMNSNFGKLRDFLITCSNSVNQICVTETWYTEKDCKKKLKFCSQRFDFIHQERKTVNKRGSILI